MHHFAYRNGVLHAEDVSIATLAEEVGTPFYCYSTATLERHYRVFGQAFAGLDARVCYAMKANSNQSVVKTLARMGAGMDVVSAGELARALEAGVQGERIVFSGVGKTGDEIAAAVDAGVFSVNIESAGELAAVDRVARERGRVQPIAIRVNPDVDAGTHAKITTGRAENKFGVALAEAPGLCREAAGLGGVKVTGVAIHIGSQVTSLKPFERAFGLVAGLVEELCRDRHDISHVDLGGGLGIPYREGDAPPHPDDYAALVRKVFAPIGATVILEPGRLIAGNAGILVARVIRVKQGNAKAFLVVDAAMNDLIRPTLYDAHHDIWPVREGGNGEPVVFDVVGPVCETGDYLALGRALPPLAEGDLIAFMTAGAYGAVQSSTYNTRPLVAEVMVHGHDHALVRPRQTVEALIGLDRVAPWLGQDGAPADTLGENVTRSRSGL